MTDDASTSPPGASPFRGGFRFLTGDDRVTVDVWGSDLTEVLPRAAEAVFRAAGEPHSLVRAPPFRIEVRGETTVELVASMVHELVTLYRSEGRFASVAACRSVVTIEEGGTLPPGVAAIVICDGGHVDSEHDSGLRRIASSDDPPGVWEEGGILRARFHLQVGRGP
jgi:hypothetical protein